MKKETRLNEGDLIPAKNRHNEWNVYKAMANVGRCEAFCDLHDGKACTGTCYKYANGARFVFIYMGEMSDFDEKVLTLTPMQAANIRQRIRDERERNARK